MNSPTNLSLSPQRTVRAASAVLFAATRGRASFRDVTVLVPSSWGPSPPCPALGTLGDAAGESWEAADLRVSKGRHPQHGARPWTLHSRGCGHRGDYVSLGHSSLTTNASALAGTSFSRCCCGSHPGPGAPRSSVSRDGGGGVLPTSGLQGHHRHSLPPGGQRLWLWQVARKASLQRSSSGRRDYSRQFQERRQALNASHSSGMIIAQLPLRGRNACLSQQKTMTRHPLSCRSWNFLDAAVIRV